jgi:pimeloyl-ACP methyl ester carboxylesterase
MPRPLERVEIPSPDGILPGYIIPAARRSPGDEVSSPPPLVIFYNGFDVTKEILYGFIRNTLADRGISCLVVDAPGTGEPLRLRNVPSRHDYEVPTTAIVDYLVSRPEIADPHRLGLLGISLGGYYAPRGAAFEPRIKAVAAWGAIYDYSATWREWRLVQPTASSVPGFQLPWVMGTLPDSTDPASTTPAAWQDAMKRATDRVGAFRLQDALPYLKQPFLVVHGEKDELIPLSDAQAVFDAAASEDKELRVFTEVEGGSEHVQIDDMDPCRQYIADWFLDKL